jgi:hypothetical protein
MWYQQSPPLSRPVRSEPTIFVVEDYVDICVVASIARKVPTTS